MSQYKCLWAFILAILAVGCTKSAPAPAPSAQTAPSADRAKAALQDVVNTGQITSGLDDVQTYLTELKKTDAAKADPLLKEFNALQSRSGEQAKAKAKEILSKL